MLVTTNPEFGRIKEGNVWYPILFFVLATKMNILKTLYYNHHATSARWIQLSIVRIHSHGIHFFLSSCGYVYLNINIFYPYCVFFSIQITYKAYCSEGYYGADCSAYCPGNPRKCVVNGHTYCKMGTFIYTSKIK